MNLSIISAANAVAVCGVLVAYWLLYLRVQKLEIWAAAQRKVDEERQDLFGTAAESITEVLERLSKIAEAQKEKAKGNLPKDNDKK